MAFFFFFSPSSLLLPCQPVSMSCTQHFPASPVLSVCLPFRSFFHSLSFLPSYSYFPSFCLPTSPPPRFLSPLYRRVFAPDASCLSSVGRISEMGPSRNSKHHSGIFFQAIAFCSNKGGVALASLSEWAYWP